MERQLDLPVFDPLIHIVARQVTGHLVKDYQLAIVRAHVACGKKGTAPIVSVKSSEIKSN